MNTTKVFCAVDTADLDRALFLSREVGAVTGALKFGLEFFSTFGPEGLDKIRNACPEAALFIDLKFHDIPNTVARAIKTISSRFKPEFLNVHAAGGMDMMKAAKEACAPETRLLAVTILTSLTDNDLDDIGYEKGGAKERAEQMARLAQKAGLDGVVCSSHEIKTLRAACGPDFQLMVPGIRPAGSDKNDQNRVMTPKQALQEGATHLVIGRPITEAADPAASAAAIIKEIGS